MVGRARLVAMLVFGLASMALLVPAASADLRGTLDQEVAEATEGSIIVRLPEPPIEYSVICVGANPSSAVCLFPFCLSLGAERVVILPDPYVEAGDDGVGACVGYTTYCC